LFVSASLIKPTPDGQDSRKNLDETRKKTKNPPKTRPNNTPQDPLGSQEGINFLYSCVQASYQPEDINQKMTFDLT
jgi:hypothetical protein